MEETHQAAGAHPSEPDPNVKPAQEQANQPSSNLPPGMGLGAMTEAEQHASFWPTANQLRHDAQPEHETDPDEPPLPRYRCHKEVSALEVETARAPTADPGTRLVLEPVDPRFETIRPSPEWLQRHKPSGRGYFVVYADGYTSWSPAEPFEEGYTLIEDEDPAE